MAENKTKVTEASVESYIENAVALANSPETPARLATLATLERLLEHRPRTLRSRLVELLPPAGNRDLVQLRPLLVLSEDIAFLGRGKAALRRHRKLVERREFRGLLHAALIVEKLLVQHVPRARPLLIFCTLPSGVAASAPSCLGVQHPNRHDLHRRH